MIEWRLFEVKQHKYKLVLGWETIWWVVLLIQFQKASYNQNINQERNAVSVYLNACRPFSNRLNCLVLAVSLAPTYSGLSFTEQCQTSTTKFKTISNLKNIDDPKNQDNLINQDDLKNEYNRKYEDILKNENIKRFIWLMLYFFDL